MGTSKQPESINRKLSTMAAPASVNIKDMTGTYTLNSKQSDSSQATLKMQGVGWLVRQAVQYSTITLHMKQYTDDKGTVHLDQESISAGNVSSMENRELNGEWGERENKIWGKVKGTTRFRKVSELEDDYLKEGWNQETLDGEASRLSMRVAPILGPPSKFMASPRLKDRGSTSGGRLRRRGSRWRRLRSFMTIRLSSGGLTLYPCFGLYHAFAP